MFKVSIEVTASEVVVKDETDVLIVAPLRGADRSDVYFCLLGLFCREILGAIRFVKGELERA